MTDVTAPRVLTRRVGSITVHALDAGRIRLDGGAMFGVVPKPLWERRIPADDRNRIPLALRCLLIEAPEALVLVDTGVGNKESEKFRGIYGIDNEGAPTRLEDAIRDTGHDPADVDLVVLTHLHFDHAGGATTAGPGGRAVPSFPGARTVVQRGELEWSASPNPRIRSSYLAHNIEPLVAAGALETIEGAVELTRGIRVRPTPGHTPHHQSVWIDGGGEVACYLADVCPTSAHVPLPWIMGYDVEPLVTLDSKARLWERASEEDWLVVFEHDPDVPWGRVTMVDGRPDFTPETGRVPGGDTG